MLFHSSIRRELARSFGATLLVLFTIVLTMLLIRVLGQANKGSVNPEEIMLVLTYSVLGRSPTILTIALFVAVVSTLSRMYRDSEMAIWMTSGLGVASLLRPVFRFAWPVLLVIASLLVWAWPWSNQQIDTLRDRFERRGDLDRIAPGQFQESADGRRVFFIEKSSGDLKEGRNLFIANRDEQGHESITSARSARIEWEEDRQVLNLFQGQHINQPVNVVTDNLKISTFSSYGLVINDKTGEGGYSGGLKSIPTLELLEPDNRFYAAELSWRLGMAITAFNFVLLAVAVSTSNPRVGKSGNLMFLLFTFVVYYNLLNMGQSWVMSQKVHWLELMLWMHGGIFILSCLWLAKRHYGWRLLPSLNRKEAT
jgi:lipopolysaccharide export system permease protein